MTTTEPPEPTPVTRVAVIGDFGHGGPAQYAVADAVKAATPDALVTTGDNFYSDAVELIWTAPYGWIAEQQLPVYAAWGNHDIETDRRIALVAGYLDPPGRWYGAALGEASLIVLDSNQIESDEQLAWLAATLATSPQPIVVTFHIPAYSCGLYRSSQQILERWVPLFEEHGVDLVLNGHEHHYERFTDGDIAYVVTGGGGQPLRPRTICPPGTPIPVSSNYVDHHFLLLEITRDSIEVTTIGVDGAVLDRVLIPDT
jgi:acid phosphatase